MILEARTEEELRAALNVGAQHPDEEIEIVMPNGVGIRGTMVGLPNVVFRGSVTFGARAEGGAVVNARFARGSGVELAGDLLLS